MKSFVALAAVAGSIGLSSLANAAVIFTAGTETGSRYNPQANAALPGGFTAANTIAFTSCVFTGSNTSVILDRLTFGIRQLGGAPTVDARVFVAQMTGDGTLNASSVQDLGLISVGAAAASTTTLVSLNLSGIMSLQVSRPAREVVARLAAFPEVGFLSVMTGSHPVAFEFNVRDGAHFDDLRARILRTDGVLTDQTTVHRKLHRQSFVWG